MKNTFGQSVSVTLFGESHGEMIGAVIDGLAPGIAVSEDFIALQLSRRRPASLIDTPRREQDNFRIVSGVFSGRTTGTPITILIPNENTRSKDYDYGRARPSHADYSAYCKYHGYEDYRGGGHFSGRVTAALTAVGGILIPALNNIGVSVGTHILTCGGVDDRKFENIAEDIAKLNKSLFPVLDETCEAKMSERIMDARNSLDSVGGITQTAINGLVPGVGEPWFDSIESVISHAIFSIGGIKGIEFGAGFAGTKLRGSEFNDGFRLSEGRVITESNNNGGINGGISNGMPIIFNCAVKPTPSIARAQHTVDFLKMEQTDIEIHGRHDPAIIRRICPVIDSVAAIALCDILAQRFGTDVFTKGVN